MKTNELFSFKNALSLICSIRQISSSKPFVIALFNSKNLFNNGDWGLVIMDRGVGRGGGGGGMGDWAQSPIPNPQAPIPNPQSP